MSLGEAQVRFSRRERELRRIVRGGTGEELGPLNDLGKYTLWRSRWGHWIARVCLLAAGATALVGLLIVASGLWSGSVGSLDKYNSRLVSRVSDPVIYWISICWYAAISAIFGWLAAHLVHAAKLRR